jgi:hypothetical protein
VTIYLGGLQALHEPIFQDRPLTCATSYSTDPQPTGMLPEDWLAGGDIGKGLRKTISASVTRIIGGTGDW